MASVKIVENDTPTEVIVKAAKKVAEVTDSRGRTLKVRKLSALNKVDLSAVVGAENARNEGVIGPCAIAFSVTEIDGEPVMQPNSYAELRALIGRLDDEGLEAAGQAHVDHFGIAPDAEELKAGVKNS